MWKPVLGLLLLMLSEAYARNTDACRKESITENIKSHKFQLCFFEELNSLLDPGANEALNGLLHELQSNKQYASHAAQIQSMIDGRAVQPKIVYLKQLLDMKLNEQWPQIDTLYTLRNLNFLSKFKRELQQLQDESVKELRKLRWYNLCQQFWFRDELIRNETLATTPKTKLAPLQATTPATVDNTGAGSNAPAAPRIDLQQFGRALYANVRTAGAEIIDDYLLTLHKLLLEVVEEKHEHAASSAEDNTHVQHAAKLTKLLREIDAILAIDDFYTKRQRLYAYLEHELAVDYEQFKSSKYAQEDLAVILSKLQRNGLDLFVTFVFSNFEFLERLHEAWLQLLPAPPALETDASAAPKVDAQTQQLYDIHTLYVVFKHDWENGARYDAYVEAVKALYTETQQGGEDMHIFELLHNASANVGTVTFNMIKAKCDEF